MGLWNTEIILRVGKAKPKYCNWSNIKNVSGNTLSLYFKEIHDFTIQDDPRNPVEESDLSEHMSYLPQERIHIDTEISNDERKIHDLLLKIDKTDINKQKKLCQLKEKGVYTKQGSN